MLGDLGPFFGDDPLKAIDTLLAYFANHPDKEAVVKFLDTLISYENLTMIVEAFLWDKAGWLSKTDWLLPIDYSDLILGLALFVGVLVAAGFLMKEAFKKLCEAIKEKVEEAVDWVMETTEKIYHFMTVELPAKVEAFMDKAVNYVEGKIQQAKDTYNKVKEKVLSTCKDVYKKATNFIKDKWSKVKKWAFSQGLTAYQAVFKIDLPVLKGYFDRLTSLSNRIQNLDDSLHTLYGRLCWNDIQEGEVLTSLANLYHLVRSDIIIDDAWKIKSCRTRLYGLINSFETIENKLYAGLDG